MPYNAETSTRSRVTGGSPEQLDRLLLGGCVAVWLAALGAGYWWMLVDAQGRSWHDRLSGTRVMPAAAGND